MVYVLYHKIAVSSKINVMDYGERTIKRNKTHENSYINESSLFSLIKFEAHYVLTFKYMDITHGAHDYRPGTHLYSWVERGTICVSTLPKGANLYKVWHRTQDH